MGGVRQFLEFPGGRGGYYVLSKMENPKGWGVLYDIPSVVGVWIFSGTTHLTSFVFLLFSIALIILDTEEQIIQ